MKISAKPVKNDADESEFSDDDFLAKKQEIFLKSTTIQDISKAKPNSLKIPK